MVGYLVALQSLFIGCAGCQQAAGETGGPPPPAAVSVACEPTCLVQEVRAGQAGSEPTESHWSSLLKDRSVGKFKFDVGGSLRHRFEHQSNFQVRRYGDPNAPSDTFLLQRLRVQGTLRHEDDWRLFAQLQDSRPFGTIFSKDDFAVGNPYWNPVDLRQLNLQREPDEDRGLGYLIGRQTISYRDNRVWGPGEWGNVGRYLWDAARLPLETPAARVEWIYAQRVITDPNRFDIEHYPYHAYGVYAMLKSLPLTLDLFYIGKSTYGNESIRAAGHHAVEDIHSFGFHVDDRWHERWDYGGTFAYSFGSREDAAVSAFGGNARLGHTFDNPWKLRIGGQFSFASGTPHPGSGRDRTFDGLFGAIDSMYGWMNLFSWKNLHDYQTTVSIKPTKKTEVILEWHYFQLDQARDAWYYANGRPQRHDPTGAAGRDLGHEIDLAWIYHYSDHWRLRAGYSHFFPGSFIRRTGPSPQADWVFFQTMWEF